MSWGMLTMASEFRYALVFVQVYALDIRHVDLK